MNGTVSLNNTTYFVKDWLLLTGNRAESVPTGTKGAVPLLDIPMMSDSEWQKKAQERKARQ